MSTPNPPDIPAAPSPAPTRSDPVNFRERADAYHTWLVPFVNVTLPAALSWIRARASEMRSWADATAAAAASAVSSATAAQASASSALDSATSAIAGAATASTKAGESSAAAVAATSSAASAAASAEAVGTKATEADASATSASASAATASSKAGESSAAAAAAAASAASSSTSAAAAASSADSAQASASSAAGSAASAQAAQNGAQAYSATALQALQEILTFAPTPTDVPTVPKIIYSPLFFDSTGAINYGVTGQYQAYHVKSGAGPAKKVYWASAGAQIVLTGRFDRIYGSVLADAVWISKYSVADARSMAGGVDRIYLPGNYAEYTHTLSADGSSISSRKAYANGLSEGAVFTTSTTAADLAVFKDGAVDLPSFKAALQAGQTPVLDPAITTDNNPPGAGAYRISSWPTNCYFADGSAASRSNDSVLFSLIGTTYGAGDGSTTFNLPAVDPADKTLTPSSGVNGLYALLTTF